MILRAIEPADLPIFYEHQCDPIALAMAGMPGRDRTAFDERGRREVGHWIGRHHWGRGVATAALVAFLGEETARPLHAGVEPQNGGSLRVLEKCGFAVCGEEDGLVILRLG